VEGVLREAELRLVDLEELGVRLRVA